MIGILAEKPSAMRNMAKALGGVTGTFNGEQYVIAAAKGHLYEYKKPESQVSSALSAKYHSWDLTNLPWSEPDFKWIRTMKDDAGSLLTQIQGTLSKCDEVVIATDNDPSGEGSLLGWEIIDELGLNSKKISRMLFEDESVRELQKAFKTRKPMTTSDKDPDYVKAVYRTKWDMLSMQFTRIATHFGDGKTVLRNGRLKSAMVLITGDQLKAVAGYKKVPFYQNRFRDENGVMYTNPNEPMFPTKDEVPNTYTASNVIVDKVEQKTSAPPKLLDLAGLSSMLEDRGFKSKDVLKTYQAMYNDQILSYPRTEDKYVTPEQFNDLLPLVDKIAAVVGVDTALLTHRTPRTTHVKTGCAHGANRPGTNVPNSLSDLTKYGACAPVIYEILAKNYLSILGEDYEYESQKGHVEKYPDFVGQVSIPKKLGYKAIFTDDDDTADDVSTVGLGKLASPFIHEGFPPKPATPTMKWLMRQLEKYDVGTGATRASTYAEITNTSSPTALLSANKGKLSLTTCGEMSYKLLPGTHIGDITITEKVYADMKDIAAGKKDADVCLQEMEQLVIDDIATMKTNSVGMRKEMNITVANKEQKEKYEGTWKGKKVSFSRVWGGHRFTDDECEALCRGEEIEVNGLVSAKGNTYGIKGKLSNQTYNGHKFVGFEKTGYADSGNGSGSNIPKEWCKHVFTEDEKLLLESGQPVHIDGCLSKKGSLFSCTVKYGTRDDGKKGIIPSFD